jgi:hypothetical protein
MISFPVAFAVLVHVLFWGAGLAMLVVPRPWRRFWPVLVAPMGFALQSAVVWAGAMAGLRGTNSYGWAAELLPAGLLVLAVRWRGGREVWKDLTRFGLVWLASAACLVAIVLPLALAAKGLTTTSLGSCDAADYAGGARVLMEFSRGDRGGFVGLTEVVQVRSVDNFFDYWMRLNWFTPSALIALNGTVLGCAPAELTSIMTMVLLAGSVPVVFWMARAVVGYGGAVSVGIAALYGLSPITWYAVAHVAPGQLLAAQAVALLTWVGVALWRGRLTVRRAGAFAGVLVAGYWLVLGSYTFFLLLCLVPAVAFAGGLAAAYGAWRRLAGWAVAMLAPLVVCGLVFYERVAGLAERFDLLQTYDFGWRIPALTPEGWLGLVSGPNLDAWSWGGGRWFLAAAVVGLLAWAVVRAVRERRRRLWIVASLTLPVLAGYAFLQWRGARLGTNASYDAYKLFAVFYPGLLPALCWWVTLRLSRRLTEWMFVAGVAAIIVLGNGAALVGFGLHMAAPPLLVGKELTALRKVEAMPDVKSVNVLLPEMWSRLWANALLLQKPQYFLTHTYEGRRNTPLRGEWDLEAGIIKVKPPDATRRAVTPHTALVDTRSPWFLRAAAGDGWHAEEWTAATGERWRWTAAGEATVRIENPHSRPLTVVCALTGWSSGERELTLTLNGGPETELRRIGAQQSQVRFPALTVPPGESVLVLRSPQPLTPAGGGDPRMLGACVVELAIEVAK